MGQNELKFEFLGVTGWIVRSFNQKLKGLLTSDVNPIPLRRGLLAPAPHLPGAPSPEPRRAQTLSSRAPSWSPASVHRGGRTALPPDPHRVLLLRAPLVPKTLSHALDTSSPQPTQEGGRGGGGDSSYLRTGPSSSFMPGPQLTLSWSLSPGLPLNWAPGNAGERWTRGKGQGVRGGGAHDP